MAEPPHLTRDGEPGYPPALPSPADIKRNLHEWKEEVRRRVRLMVQSCIQDGRQPTAESLRKLGPDGQRHFRKQLQKAMSREIAANADLRRTEIRTNSRPASPGKPRPQLQLSKDWRDCQYERPACARRAAASGLKLALGLTATGILLLYAVSDHSILDTLSAVQKGLFQ